MEKKSKSRQNVNATDITLKLLVHPLKPLSVNSPQLPSGNLVLRFKEREDFGLEASILSWRTEGKKWQKKNYLQPEVYTKHIPILFWLASGIIRKSACSNPSEVISSKSGSFIEWFWVCCSWMKRTQSLHVTAQKSTICWCKSSKKNGGSCQLSLFLARRLCLVIHCACIFAWSNILCLYIIQYKSYIYIYIHPRYFHMSNSYFRYSPSIHLISPQEKWPAVPSNVQSRNLQSRRCYSKRSLVVNFKFPTGCFLTNGGAEKMYNIIYIYIYVYIEACIFVGGGG